MRVRILLLIIGMVALLVVACRQPEATATPEAPATEAAESETAVPEEEDAEPETAVPTPSPEPTEEPEETAEATAEPVQNPSFQRRLSPTRRAGRSALAASLRTRTLSSPWASLRRW